MEAIRGRRSIRVFDGTPVDSGLVSKLITAATFAPSRMNTQPWHFHIATGDARRRVAAVMAMTTSFLEDYVDALGAEMVEHAARFYADLGGAPVVIGVATPHEDDTFSARDDAISVGAAIENLLLAAHAHGLGACSISVPRWITDRLHEVFEVAPGWEIMSIIVLGTADETPQPKHPHEDVVTFLT